MASTLPAFGSLRSPRSSRLPPCSPTSRSQTTATSTGAMPFDNGQFVGLSQTWTACAGGTTDVVIVAARPADDAFNLFAIVQEEVGDGMLSTIVDSLAIDDPTMYPPQSPATPVTPEGTVPESLWQRPAGVDTVIVIDRLRQIKVEVPSSWMDVRNYPSIADDASGRPRIVASLHIDTMNQQFEVPGVAFIEHPYADAGLYLADVLDGSIRVR